MEPKPQTTLLDLFSFYLDIIHFGFLPFLSIITVHTRLAHPCLGTASPLFFAVWVTLFATALELEVTELSPYIANFPNDNLVWLQNGTNPLLVDCSSNNT
ncbi:hypothetical protein NXS19_002472 [Fusarium pseudograminearum]|nr:hypothetical protein NXS19_002472 [Fusarium pseudograminearum]